MKKISPRMGLKKRISQWRVGDFLRQLSVVVLGIIITFVGSDLISQAMTRSKVKTALNLLVTEMTDNRASILAMKKKFERERDFGQYLRRYKDNIAAASVDTLERNEFIMFQIADFEPRTEVFEMMKSSGLLQAIDDPTLIIQLISTYRDMQTAAGNAKFYYENKSDVMQKINDDQRWWTWYETIDHKTIAAAKFFEKMVKFPLFLRLCALPSGCIDSESSFSPALESIDRSVEQIKTLYDL